MAANGSDSKTYFEQQRQLLIGDVAAVSRPVRCSILVNLTIVTESGKCATKHQQAESEFGGRDCRMYMSESPFEHIADYLQGRQ